MAKEIERKFLVDLNKLKLPERALVIRQGYIPRGNGITVRIRMQDTTGYMTIKGMTVGISRDEYEYEIPLEDAEAMLDKFCDERVIKKIRYLVPAGKHTWEIDFFEGENDGLVVAEIELNSESELFEKPDWVGKEVTDEKKYYNALLMDNPYSKW